MEGKHTSVSIGEPQEVGLVKNNWRVETTEGGLGRSAFDYADTPEKATANAILRAAAPDLLEALSAARDTVYWSECDGDFDDPMARYRGPVSMKGRALLAKIDAAIAKATQ